MNTKKIGMISFTVLLLLAITAIAFAAVGGLNSFSTGNPISSSQMNANFTTLTSQMPRIKTVFTYGSPVLTSAYTNVLIITFNAPTAGQVKLTGNGLISTNKTAAGASSLFVGIASTSGGAPTTSNLTRLYRDSTDTGGYLEVPYAVHAVFSVPAGSSTYYLVANMSGSTGGVYNNRLTAEFFPDTF